MPKKFKVVGPPGTGKTTYLLRQIEKACLKHEPERIGAVSFSKGAVVEMRSRVAHTLGMSQGAARNIRTIHSHCYKLLGLKKEDIVTEDSKHIRTWNEAYPKWCLFTANLIEDLEDGPDFETHDYNEVDNRKRYSRMNIYRGRGIPVSDWHDEEAEHFYRDWMNWLQESDLWDFPMTLERVLAMHYKPDIDVLFVDEAQDLSTQQINVVNLWAESCSSVVVVGDEDQTLYKFLGAVPEDFRNLPHDWRNVLSQSYRVPKAAHAYAMQLISQIKDREQVEYLPTEIEGSLRNDFFPDLSLPGNHMILTRCNYHLKRWVKYLTQQGRVWHNPYRDGVKAWNPASTQLWEAIKTYDRLKSGLDVRGGDLITMIGKMPADMMERGVKTSRKKMIDRDIGPKAKTDVFGLSSLPYFKADFFNFTESIGRLFPLSGAVGDLVGLHGPEITRQSPDVILGTVHSVKGGESDHVWVDKSTSPNIMRAINENDDSFDDEVRLAYVAVTRTKNTLGLLVPNGPEAGIWV